MSQLPLSEYPAAIAAAETAVLRAQQAARSLAEAVTLRRAEFAHVIAFDKTLTNEAQRKGGMAELEGTDAEYLELQTQHQAAKDAVVMAQIEADLQQNLFRVALLANQSVATQERRLGAMEY